MSEEASKDPRVVTLESAATKREKLKLERERIIAKIRGLYHDVEAEYQLDREGILLAAAQLPPSHDQEIARTICDHFGLAGYDIPQWARAIRELRDDTVDARPRKKKNQPQEATEGDYFRLFQDFFGAETRRDIFSGDLMYEQAGLWNPCYDKKEIHHLKAIANNIEQIGGPKFRPGYIESYFFKYESGFEPRFIPEIPIWDGRDRIQEIAQCLSLKAPLSMYDAEMFIKDWLSKAMKKLETPESENRILVFRGPQGAGKDHMIRTLIGAAGQWAAPVTVSSDEKDALIQLNENLFLNIAEFDRITKWESGFMKDLITRPSTKVRAPFGYNAKFRWAGASFVATCNQVEILKDHTGARRYIILDVTSISWAYPDSIADRFQILAQAKHLASLGFCAPDDSERRLKAVLGGELPDDPAVALMDVWYACVIERWSALTFSDREEILDRGWITVREAQPILDEFCRKTKASIIHAQKLLKSANLGKRDKNTRGYAIPENLTAPKDAFFD